MTDNQVTLEPVAWMYERNGKQSLQFSRQRYLTTPARGWTETPLYSAPPAPSGGEVERLAAVLWERVDDRVWNDPRIAMLDRDEWRSLARAALAAMDRAPGVKYTDAGLAPQRKPLADAFSGIDVVKNHALAQPAPRPVEVGEVTQGDGIAALDLIGWLANRLQLDGDTPPGFRDHIAEFLARHRQQSLSAARAEIERLKDALAMAVAEMARASGRLEMIAGCNEDRRIAAALSGTCDFARAALSTDQGEG